MATKQAKPGIKHTFETETVKQFSSVVQKQVIEESGKDILSQVFGADFGNSSEKAAPQTEANHNQDPRTGWVDLFDIFHHKKANGESKSSHEKKGEISAAMNYGQEIAHSENISKKELRDMDHKVEQIMQELKKLVQSSKILQVEFAEVAVEDKPVSVGQYHLNFFEWMLIVIRNAREKVEDSGAWLSTVKGKNGKKGYWGMFKKHGTSFGMSNERSVATQTG